MDAREFAEWIAYDQIEPFGALRDDQRAGTIASAVVNIWKSSGTPLDWQDFFPSYETRNPEQDYTKLLAKIELFNQLLGGEDKRTNKPAPEY